MAAQAVHDTIRGHYEADKEHEAAIQALHMVELEVPVPETWERGQTITIELPGEAGGHLYVPGVFLPGGAKPGETCDQVHCTVNPNPITVPSNCTPLSMPIRSCVLKSLPWRTCRKQNSRSKHW